MQRETKIHSWPGVLSQQGKEEIGGLSQSFAPKVFGSGGKLKRCFAREAEIFAGQRPDQDDKGAPNAYIGDPYGATKC